jgi:uncharacterized protein YbbK (DUF523 family)/uncharacterized protein YbgA (DUF1722 family)
MAPDPRPLLGVSSCLLGEAVRYDGGDKRAPYLTDVLGPQVGWVEVCPEVELGMGVPREPVDLHPGPDGPRMLGAESGRDWTEAFGRWAAGRLAELPRLDGWVLKSRSPSCGLAVAHGEAGAGSGLWAAALAVSDARLPLIEAESLVHDLLARDVFLTRCFVGARLRGIETDEDVAALHRRLGLLLESQRAGSHGEAGARLEQGDRVGWANTIREALASTARAGHLETLQVLATRAGADLDPDRVGRLAEAADAYRDGLAPLERARSILRSWARRHDAHGLGRQLWLEPYPRTLALLVVG